MAKMTKIYARTPKWKGFTHGVEFIDGVGETSDERAVNFFRNNGYIIEGEADDPTLLVDAKARAQAENYEHGVLCEPLPHDFVPESEKQARQAGMPEEKIADLRPMADTFPLDTAKAEADAQAQLDADTDAKAKNGAETDAKPAKPAAKPAAKATKK